VLSLAAAKSAAFEDSLKASAEWQEAVALGKRLLASVADREVGANPHATADAEVLDVWRRAQRLTCLPPR
jgi:hypothetical protein